MHLVSTAKTPEAMRDEIGKYVSLQANNFHSRVKIAANKTDEGKYQAIGDALAVIAEMVRGIVIE